MSQQVLAGVTVIARRPQKVGGRAYAPGDIVPTDDINPRRIRQMIDGRHLSILTPESYRSALTARTDGRTIARGFTAAGLVSLGIMTEEEVKEAPAPERKSTLPTAAEAAPGAMIDGPNGYKLVKHVRGVGAFYDIHDAAGARLTEKMVKGMPGVTKWIAKHEAAKAKVASAKAAAEAGA